MAPPYVDKDPELAALHEESVSKAEEDAVRQRLRGGA